MAAGEKWRVMVVDDDVPLLDSVVEILNTEFDAFGAINGLDALEKLERYEPDLIILDVAMPCVDGIDTCRAIRKNARFRAVPVVFLSGRDESTYVDRAKGLGVIRFLRKPVTPMMLLECCRELSGTIQAKAPPRKRHSITELETFDSEPTNEQAVAHAATADTTTRERPAPPGSAAQPTQPYGRPAPARIMIIDDDSDVISYMLAILRDHFEVFGVSDPISAIYKIIRYQPDLVILDITMPHLSGYQLSQLIRLNRNLRAIKILFASSKDTPQEIAYAKKLGAADYLAKPFGAEDLLGKVTAIVDAPDFIVREKALSLEDIRRAERDEPSPVQFV